MQSKPDKKSQPSKTSSAFLAVMAFGSIAIGGSHDMTGPSWVGILIAAHCIIASVVFIYAAATVLQGE